MPTNQDALRRLGGMYGAAYRDAELLAEAVEVSGAVEVNRVEVPLVGTTKQGYKPGRESREGTLRIQKIDARWELEMYEFLSQSLVTRRSNRGNPAATLRKFDLILEIDDPDAFGFEAWKLEGCQIWRMPVGFSISDDIIDREFPFTWENETPTDAYVVDAAGVVTYKYGDGNR